MMQIRRNQNSNNGSTSMVNGSTSMVVMVQGTASNVGKSILVAGLCRIFREDGFSVAPFKAQNMALNSFVTESGLEMGRAQVTQAMACQIKADVHMNPVLIKPSSDSGSQVIVMGKPAGNMNIKTYGRMRERLKTVIKDAYHHLRSQYDIIVIEGAGSPAEVNLKKDEITNMHVAKMANCPVLIVGDIDRGGVYAHLIGTFDLLDQQEQDLTAGFIINKFRGDSSLLAPANDFLEQRTNRKLYGVVPMIRELNLPDEDSVQFKKQVVKHAGMRDGMINIAVIDLPHISNFTDFDVFALDADVNLVVTESPRHLEKFNMIIIPGSKNTLWDMNYLRKKGFVPALNSCARMGKMIVGICGGYQMLGKCILDPEEVESHGKEVQGLGFLDIRTVISREKRLTQVRASCGKENIPVTGYEIHHGCTEVNETPLIRDIGNGDRVLGCSNKSGNIWGTYIHGVFDSGAFRKYILDRLSSQSSPRADYDIEPQLSRLASVLRDSLDIPAIYSLLGKTTPGS